MKIPLLSVSLAIMAAVGPGSNDHVPMTAQQKKAALEPLTRRASECVARAVAADPRSRDEAASLGDVIVDAIPSCLAPIRAMMDARDEYFGEGEGERFFMGPYLDALPAEVSARLKASRP